MYTEEEGYTKEKRKHGNFKRSFSLKNMHVLGYSQFLSNIPMDIVVDIKTSPPISVSLLLSVEQNSGFLAGHMASQNKDYISQHPLQPDMELLLSSNQ